MDHEGFRRFLECLDGLGLPAEGFAAGGDEGEGDFTDLGSSKSACGCSDRRRRGGWFETGWCTTYEAGERKFEHEEVGSALVATDFLQGKGTGSVAAGFTGSRFGFCDNEDCISRP